MVPDQRFELFALICTQPHDILLYGNVLSSHARLHRSGATEAEAGEATMSMGDTLRSILTRLVAYVAVVIAAGLLFLAGATVYELMWPRPVVPFSQMSRP